MLAAMHAEHDQADMEDQDGWRQVLWRRLVNGWSGTPPMRQHPRHGKAWFIPESYAKEIAAMKALGTVDPRDTYIMPMLSHFASPDGALGYIVMPYLGTFTMHNAIRLHYTHRKPVICMHLVRTWIRQISCGLLRAARAGFIHRDLKPGNVVLSQQYATAMIVDWGLSEPIDETGTASATLSQTFDYRAPEVFTKYHMAEQATKLDVWSLGCILYELLTGVVLFDSNGDQDEVYQLARIQDELGQPILSHEPFPLRAPVFVEGVTHVKINVVTDPQARDLILKMLTIDPTKRISLSGCLSHPFLAKLTEPNSRAAGLAAALVLRGYEVQLHKTNSVRIEPAVPVIAAAAAVTAPAPALASSQSMSDVKSIAPIPPIHSHYPSPRAAAAAVSLNLMQAGGSSEYKAAPHTRRVTQAALAFLQTPGGVPMPPPFNSP